MNIQNRVIIDHYAGNGRIADIVLETPVEDKNFLETACNNVIPTCEWRGLLSMKQRVVISPAIPKLELPSRLEFVGNISLADRTK